MCHWDRDYSGAGELVEGALAATQPAQSRLLALSHPRFRRPRLLSLSLLHFRHLIQRQRRPLRRLPHLLPHLLPLPRPFLGIAILLTGLIIRQLIALYANPGNPLRIITSERSKLTSNRVYLGRR